MCTSKTKAKARQQSAIQTGDEKDWWHVLVKASPPCPGWCGSVDWAPVCKPKGRWFDSQSGHMPGWQARSPVGHETTTHWCFSSSFSHPSPLKINEQNLLLRKALSCAKQDSISGKPDQDPASTDPRKPQYHAGYQSSDSSFHLNKELTKLLNMCQITCLEIITHCLCCRNKWDR